MNEKAKQLVALLFVAGEGVSKRELAKLLDISLQELLTLLAEVTTRISGSGLALVAVDHEVELTTSPDVATWMASIAGNEPKELSRAAAEVLAVIAYKGPVTRYEVDLIRGVDSRRSLHHLIRRGIVARLPRRGRAPRYDITPEFLKHLGLTDRKQLPGYQELTTHPSLAQFLQRNS